MLKYKLLGWYSDNGGCIFNAFMTTYSAKFQFDKSKNKVTFYGKRKQSKEFATELLYDSTAKIYRKLQTSRGKCLLTTFPMA